MQHVLRMAATFVAAWFGLTSAPTLAADWRLTATRSTKYGSSLSFVDVTSITGARGQVSFWAWTFFGRKTKGMNRVRALVTADCSTTEYRFQQISLSYHQKPLGNWSSSTSAVAKPPSNLFDQINGVCGITDLGPHIDNPETFALHYFATAQRGHFRRS